MVIMLILRVFGMRYPTLVSVKRKMATLTMGVKMRVNRWNTNSQRENGPKCYEHTDAVEFRRSYHQTLNTSRNLPAECCTSIHHGWRYRCKHHTTLPLHRKRYTTIFFSLLYPNNRSYPLVLRGIPQRCRDRRPSLPRVAVISVSESLPGLATRLGVLSILGLLSLPEWLWRTNPELSSGISQILALT